MVATHRTRSAITKLSGEPARVVAAFRGSILVITSPAIEGRLANGKPYGSPRGIV